MNLSLDLGIWVGLTIIVAMPTKVRSSTAMMAIFALGVFLGGCEQPQASTSTLAWTPQPVVVTSVPPTIQPTGIVSQRAFCEDNARFIEDLTLPDGTVVAPGGQLDKRWSVQNNGTCDWGPGYTLVRLGEDEFGGADKIALYPARAGTAALWQVALVAPEEPGDYLSRWQAQDPEGYLFGDEVFLLIIVERPTPEPSSTPLITQETDSP